MGEEGKVFKKDEYVRVIGTCEEWDDLIGVVEEFSQPDGTTTEKQKPESKVVVYFPLSRDDFKEFPRLRDVNEYTSYCRQELKAYQGRKVFEPENLEVVDKAEL